MLKLFSVPIHSRKLNLNIEEITEYCVSIKKDTKSVSAVSSVGGWQSPHLTGDPPVLNDLFFNILKSSEKYREVISYKYPLRLGAVWININGYKDYNRQHIHPHSVISGAYYLTSNNSNIVFLNPALDLMEYDWSSHAIKDYNEHNSATWSIKPSQNELLLFPGWLKHKVEPNLDKEDRISISFNLDR